MNLKAYIKKGLGIPASITLNRDTLLRTFSYRWQRKFYKRHYNTQELLEKMKKMGMKEGSCVFIHSSWNSFFNYDGTEMELIEGILDVLGPTGTLVMPAFPLQKKKIFNVKKSVTGAGLLAEAFRCYPGVKRSINVQHSVCAVGPLSDYLLGEHYLCETCWDEKSPFYKLSQVDALIFCLGLGYSFMGTVIHCVEAINRKSINYYTDFFTKEKVTHEYIDIDGYTKEYQCYDIAVNRQFGVLPEKIFLHRYFRNNEYQFSRISNLTIIRYKAGRYIPRLIELGAKGIDVYSAPSKKNYSFSEK